MTVSGSTASPIAREQFEALRQRFRQDEWRGRNRLDEALFVQNYHFFSDQIPGWQAGRSRTIQLPNLPPLVRVMIQAVDNQERLLKLDIYETSSREAAHDLMVQTLASFQLTPDVQPGEEIGDVAFSVASERGVIFARGNLLFVVLNAGSQLVPTTEIAALLDQAIVSKPETTQEAPANIVLAPTAATPTAPMSVRSLELQQAESSEPPMLKLFSRGGSFYRDDQNDLAFSPAEADARAEGYAIEQDGTVSRIDIALEKREEPPRSQPKKNPPRKKKE